MQSRPLEAAPIPIREDLAAAFAATCSEFAEPGAWLTGTQRLAVAAEARNAWDCALCRRRKDALSPYGIEGDHLHLGALADGWVDVVHRIVTDSGRITERWYRSVVPEPIPADVFIEILSVATLVTCCDVFTSGIGIAPAALPPAVAGSPACERPPGAKDGPGWAPSVAPEDAGPELGDFYAAGPHFIRRALTLVPDEARRFWALMNAFYLPDPTIVELEGLDRGISRAQIEFLAARVSALLDCFY